MFSPTSQCCRSMILCTALFMVLLTVSFAKDGIVNNNDDVVVRGVRRGSGSGGNSNNNNKNNNNIEEDSRYGKAGPCHNSDVKLLMTHPILCRMLDRLEMDPDGLAVEMHDWAKQHGLLVGSNHDWSSERHDDVIVKPSQASSATTSGGTSTTTTSNQQLPVVFAHGMGDSCFNSGMIHIGNHTSTLLGGVYVTCVPTGKSQSEDTTNGYFLNMDASVDVFAETVANDPLLQDGFHAIGFSQGNNVIRGYIARYNSPPVNTFLAVNGVNAGEGTVPGCFPNNVQDGDGGVHVSGFCDLLLEQASRRAYTEFAQHHSFQANYWRDPRTQQQENYYTYSQLARWNNEGPNNHNQTLNDNYARTSKFVWIMATLDEMVWPKEGEQWGAPDPKGPFNHILPMNETEWYVKDLFGLRTAQEAGKNYFESFEGDHLQFSMDDFDRWVKTYLATTTDLDMQQPQPTRID